MWKPAVFAREIYHHSKPCVGIFIRDGAGRVLLATRAVEPGRGLYDVPGGFLKYGEHPKKGAEREASEETGLTIEVGRLIGIYMGRYGDKPDADWTLNVAYEATVLSGTLQAASDVESLAWFDRAAIPLEALAFAWIRDALRDL